MKKFQFKNFYFKNLLVLFLGLIVLSANAQNCPKPSKKAKAYYEKAELYRFKGGDAYKNLIEAVKLQADYAEALTALAYVNSKKDQSNPQIRNRTKDYYEKSHLACPSYRNYESTYWLAKFHFDLKEYEQAEPYLNYYIENASFKESNSMKQAKSMKARITAYYDLFKNPVPFHPEKVKGASTKRDEYLPMLSPDNQFLFFTRKVEDEDKSAVSGEDREYFIQSRRNYDGTYSEGIPMPTPFNQGAYQGGASISIDNKLIFITIVNQEPHPSGVLFSNGDIYYAEFKNGSWGTLKSIGDNINQRFSWEGQPSISADNKTLYFASARAEDNFGKLDLYKSNRNPDGSWGDPINLGPTINTSGNEKSPFMHSDSYTLYFSSDGHPGVGGQDIFFARINKFGAFETPVNIGVPINTVDDEHGFMVSTDGKFGYFSSNLEKQGLDIYSFELPVEARPEEVVFVKGKVESEDPDAAKGMSIELKNMATNEVIEGVVDEESGEYVAVISAKESEDVMMMARKEGYAFTSQYINSDESVVGKPKRVAPMEFSPIKRGETYRINNLNFATDSYELSPQVMNILDEFILFLENNPNVKVAIHGHTDNVGDDNDNLILSSKRAKAVQDYLIIEGIDPVRLSYKGFGEKQAIASNDSSEGRAKNRRTEFIILSK